MAFLLLASTGSEEEKGVGDQETLSMRPSWVVWVLLMTVLLLPVMVIAEPSVARGTALANACAACHGPDGHSQGAIPSIASLPTQDFIAALIAFRADARKGTVMNLIAKGLDDTDINAVAAHLATLRQR